VYGTEDVADSVNSSVKEHFSNSDNKTATNIASFDNLKNNPNIKG
jgi:hypothetical protein